MKKTAISIMIVSFIFSLQISNLQSALSDFKKDVEKEESEKSRKSSSSSSSTPSSSSSSLSDDNDDDGCGEITIGIILLWGIHNFGLKYNQYPYQFRDSNNFIFHVAKYDTISDSQEDAPKSNTENSAITESDKAENTVTVESVKPENKSSGFNKGLRHEDKNYYYTLEAGGQYAFDDGTGAFAAIRGKFYKLIGPELEVKRIRDDKDYLDYFAFGLNIPICQFSGFLPDFYFQRSYLKGILDRSGFAYGIIINSYPVKPFSFMLRIGKQSYNNIKGENYGNIDFFDYEGRVGVLFNRLEIFAGYRHLGAKYAKLRGPVFGLKVFI